MLQGSLIPWLRGRWKTFIDFCPCPRLLHGSRSLRIIIQVFYLCSLDFLVFSRHNFLNKGDVSKSWPSICFLELTKPVVPSPTEDMVCTITEVPVEEIAGIMKKPDTNLITASAHSSISSSTSVICDIPPIDLPHILNWNFGIFTLEKLSDYRWEPISKL